MLAEGFQTDLRRFQLVSNGLDGFRDGFKASQDVSSRFQGFAGSFSEQAEHF